MAQISCADHAGARSFYTRLPHTNEHVAYYLEQSHVVMLIIFVSMLNMAMCYPKVYCIGNQCFACQQQRRNTDTSEQRKQFSAN